MDLDSRRPAAASTHPDDPVATVTSVLDALGFTPRRQPGGADTATVAGGPVDPAMLEPFGTPAACVVRLPAPHRPPAELS